MNGMETAQRIPALMYHRVGEAHNAWEARYCIPPHRFAAHMRALGDAGMQAVHLEDFIAWLEGQRNLPRGAFLITFDDGFLGVLEHAAPVLERLGWPATMFLVSQLIGKTDEWCRNDPRNTTGATYPLMNQAQLQELRGAGFTLQSHTRSHPDLTTLSDESLAEELAQSRQELQQLLDQPIDYLAYPYGRHDERVMEAARQAGYHAAFSTRSGFNRRDVNPFQIRRIDVYGTDTPAMLLRKVRLGCNDGSLRHSLRYYAGRVAARLGA